MRLDPGTPIDVWCVETRLGSGGMGAVYRCFNRSAPRIRAALKILDPTLAYDPEIRARFVREAELLFQLSHPNIVKVRNINMDASPPFIEMAFCQGRPLDAVLADGPLPVEVAALVGAQIAEALAYVHDQGIRHRDVKPGNIIVNGDLVTLVDFGIATEGAARTMNLSGGALGTVAYAPPEWGSRSNNDPALWDAYSLGQVIWECITGRPAFAMPPGMAMREGIFHLMTVKGESGPLELPPEAPAPLRALVQALTHPDTAQRQGDLRAAAAILFEHAQRETGFLPEIEPLGEPTVMVLMEEESGGSDTIFFHDDMDSENAGDGGQVPNLAAWSDGSAASPGAATVADPSLKLPASRATRSSSSRPVLLAMFGVVALGLAAGGAAMMMSAEESSSTPAAAATTLGRPTKLAYVGTKPDTAYTTYINDKAIDPETALNLVPKDYKFKVVVGEDCAKVDGKHPTWCGVFEKSKRITSGSLDAVTVVLNYPEPSPPGVALSLSGASANKLRIDDGDFSDIKGKTIELDDLTPGRHTLLLRGGSCPEPVPCPEDCPKTCSEASVEVVVPFHDEATVTAELTIPPREEPVRATRTRGLVTQRQFVKWLAANPRYHPDKIRDSRQADANYLKTWNLDRPSNRAADEVAPVIAAIYCGRKGLASVDAAPKTWPEGAIGFEIRAGSSGQPVLLSFNGSVSRVRSAQSVRTAGFRCR
jgi:serine/threonine protein kinase